MRNNKLTEGIRGAKEGVAECYTDAMQQSGQSEQMSVTISMPGKNISVTTDSADEIGNILRLAGINVGGASAEPEIAIAVEPGAMGGEAPEAELPPMGAQTMGQQPPMDPRLDADGDGDHDMQDHGAEPDVEEAAGDVSRTSKGGTVTQTATGQVHKAGPGNYGGSEEDHEDDTPVPAGAVPEKEEEEEVKESGYVKEASGIMISGKEVDRASLQVDGVDSRDYPDFSDAYISQASFTDGTDLSEDEMNELNDQHGEIANELAFDSLHESSGDPKMSQDDFEFPENGPLGYKVGSPDDMNSIHIFDKTTGKIVNHSKFTYFDQEPTQEELEELFYYVDESSARILQLAGVTNEAQSAAQKAAFAKMIAKKNGGKSDAKADDKDDNKKPDADGDGIPDWADKDKEVKEDAPATASNVYGQGVYEGQQEYSRILALAGINEWANSPQGKADDKGTTFDKLPSKPGTGGGHADYGQNRANGQGENPMGTTDIGVEEAFEIAMGEYRKFVSESITGKK